MYNFLLMTVIMLVVHIHTHNTQKLGLKEFCEKVSVRAILNILLHNYMTTGYNR